MHVFDLIVVCVHGLHPHDCDGESEAVRDAKSGVERHYRTLGRQSHCNNCINCCCIELTVHCVTAWGICLNVHVDELGKSITEC